MNKPSGKKSALQEALAQAQPDRVKRLLEPKFLLGLGAALLLGAALFCAWQSWLVFSELRGTDEAEHVGLQEVDALSKFVGETRTRILLAASSDAVAAALAQTPADTEAAAQALKQVMPDLIAVDFYRADLNDVLSSDFSKFGYAKAAMLVQAHQFQRAAPLQSHVNAQKQRTLVFALPIQRGKDVLGFAYVELPFEPLQRIFRQPSVSNARIDLRQG